ncbi:MAG: hypothetical protein NVS3B5_13120 [Sphingomicrobium sp.]
MLVACLVVSTQTSGKTILKPADHINAQAFLSRAEALIAKGPFAFFSSDLKQLQAIVEDNGDIIHDDMIADRASHARPQYCPPAKHEYIGARELINGLRSMPSSEREQIDLQTAMRRILAKLHPCGRRQL